jgi:hypothetical protein
MYRFQMARKSPRVLPLQKRGGSEMLARAHGLDIRLSSTVAI